MFKKQLSKFVDFLEKHEKKLWLIVYCGSPLAFLMLLFGASGKFAKWYGAIGFIFFLASLVKSIKQQFNKK